jgi:3-oxoadipate CoA-transferase beta subunit
VTKSGAPKIVNTCSYPLTSAGVVTKIFTDLAVIDVTDNGLLVREMVAGLSLDDLQTVTEPKLTAANDLKVLAPPAV